MKVTDDKERIGRNERVSSTGIQPSLLSIDGHRVIGYRLMEQWFNLSRKSAIQTQIRNDFSVSVDSFCATANRPIHDLILLVSHGGSIDIRNGERTLEENGTNTIERSNTN